MGSNTTNESRDKKESYVISTTTKNEVLCDPLTSHTIALYSIKNPCIAFLLTKLSKLKSIKISFLKQLDSPN